MQDQSENQRVEEGADFKSVLIVGAGAMGCLFGGLLLRSVSAEVVFVESREDKRRALKANGLTFVQGGSREVFDVEVLAPGEAEEIERADLIIVCVKAYDTRAVAEWLAACQDGRALVLTLQNGLGNIETLVELLGESRVIAGTTSLGAYMPDMTTVVYAGSGDVRIGELTGEITPRVERVSRLFRTCGVLADSTNDVQRLVWSKLIVNVGINALTSVLRVENGVLLDIQKARELMVDLVTEALKVARKEGVEFVEEEMKQEVIKVAESTASNRSSMLSDILVGNETEIEYINGAVARRAKKFGLAAPVNSVLCKLVQAGREARLREKDIFANSP